MICVRLLLYNLNQIMKYSKISNLGVSKTTFKTAQQTCQEHEGQPYTNFCSSLSCARALCPQCIENHYIYHKNLRTQPEIESFKSLRNNCLRKIADILDKIGIQDSEMVISQLNGVFEGSIRRIREARDHCRKIVDTYFTNLEQHVRKRMSNVMSDQSDLFVQLQKANSIISELKLLYNKLQDSKGFLSAAHTVIKLDGEKIEDKIKQCLLTVNNLKDHHRISLFIEKNYQQRVVSFLSKLVFYGNQDNLESMPKVAEQLIVQTHQDKSYMNRSSNSFVPDKSYTGYDKPPQGYPDVGYKNLSRGSQRNQEDSRERLSMSRKSSTNEKSTKKSIIGMNTFKQSAQKKYLHFFQNDENILHILDLETDPEFIEVQLDLTFKIPEFHKSIAVPNGDLYLLGGNIPNSSNKSTKIYKYDFLRRSLIAVNSLKYGRSSHSICFNNKYIYVLGGFLNNQLITNKCERYDIINNKVQEIRPMNYGVCSFACCSFNGRYIYKFGGISEDNSITHYIEVFDEKQGYWSVVNPVVDLQNKNLLSLSTSSAIQITQNQIMVMGGYDEGNSGQKQTYILKVEQTGSMIRQINAYPLPYAEGFWNNIPIIQNKLVFALQNVSTGDDQCIENVRRILIFDGVQWKCLNE